MLHLLAPRVRRYFPADVLAALEPPAPSLVDGMLTWLHAIVTVNVFMFVNVIVNTYITNFVELYLSILHIELVVSYSIPWTYVFTTCKVLITHLGFTYILCNLLSVYRERLS